ncbi:MAG: OpgC domain-containing protein [Gammaproteobacteria bacterium]|nr:OpgC domain-containing protein [Gammaproteobacteria bacterium]MBU1655208.1 OpgC domain-containing protein [Gammaproteobacteria bacterium]MBU1961114.1 OpgC domain-containing protein [Gammaproteobacteria bacterium]
MTETERSEAPVGAVDAPRSTWAYPDGLFKRDLRMDFMRGFAMLLVFIGHFNYFSLYMFIGWERIGVVSSAETFIALASIVTGLIYRKRLQRDGFAACSSVLVDRGLELYRIMVVMILLIGLIRYIPFIDSLTVTTFTDQFTKVVYSMYPSKEEGILYLIRQSLLLRAGPHQFQIIGLYVVLFMTTPLILWMIVKQRVGLVLALSWGLYLINLTTPESVPGTAEIRLTGAQFEYGFPIMAWQLIFVHGVVVGYYWNEVMAFMALPKGRIVLWTAIVLSIGFILFTFNNPLSEFPTWSRLSWVPADEFRQLYQSYFLKYKLGPGRLLNSIVLLIAAYALLTRVWHPFYRALGWFFIPIGQASLYVFFIHVFILLLVSNTPLPAYNNFWVNTGIHTFVLLLAWIMVKRQFMFRWIPH